MKALLWCALIFLIPSLGYLGVRAYRRYMDMARRDCDY